LVGEPKTGKTMVNGNKFIFECLDCGEQYGPDEVMYLCPSCSLGNTPGKPPQGVLKTLYDFHRLKRLSGRRNGFQDLKKTGFLDLLPLQSMDAMPPLHIGNTPLYTYQGFRENAFPFRLFLKDDSQNPTYSFKDRASALVSAFAREKGLKTIVAASTGNAGSSIAGICASQGQQAVVLVPETAPMAKLSQIIMYGACIVPVRGTYDEAFDLSIRATERFGWYNRNTAFNPLTIEGKKTVAFELFEQMQGRVPDRIFVPVGDGVIISGVYKGYEDLLAIGLIEEMPLIVGVQSEGSDNLVRNLHATEFMAKPSHTLADSISVDVPRNFFMARHYIHRYDGEIITLTDEAILHATALLAAETGLFTEPASGAAFAGLLAHTREGKIRPGSDNVVLLTGSGLKDLKSLAGSLKVPAAIEPGIGNLSVIWEEHVEKMKIRNRK
jgi:threonine synthase